ncbi:CDC42 small effector protein 2-like isoform X2 [Paramacrobiotus metropolitanus]|uniref:CDC42 small effector protein 2-like isoform X2 n=1 Tax=Paramacrobiotus metropolitanus TaxID=2943436 RepID=UPI002446482E|nr:CDC42 small effector protein 2-like isoform X2 [Paramacrobiotus metropolitanus]
MTASVAHLWRNCCGVPTPSPQRIDRSMIGLPTDFRHVGHIGSTDMGATTSSTSLLAVQSQMRSKGGYEEALPVNYVLRVRDLNQSQDKPVPPPRTQ